MGDLEAIIQNKGSKSVVVFNVDVLSLYFKIVKMFTTQKQKKGGRASKFVFLTNMCSFLFLCVTVISDTP